MYIYILNNHNMKIFLSFILILTLASCTLKSKELTATTTTEKRDSTMTSEAVTVTIERVDTTVVIAERKDSATFNPTAIDSLIQVIIDNDRQRVEVSKDKKTGRLKVNATVKEQKKVVQKTVEKREKQQIKSRIKTYEKSNKKNEDSSKFSLKGFTFALWVVVIIVLVYLGYRGWRKFTP